MQKDFVWATKEKFYLSPLGRLRNSRLPRLLRFQMRLVYGIKTFPVALPGLGYVSISTEADPGNLELVAKSILAELKKFIEEGPSEEEIAFSKRFLSSWWQMSFDNPSEIATWIISELMGLDERVFLPEDYIDLVRNWTQKEFHEVVSGYWDLEKIQITVQGPFKDGKKMTTRMEKMLEESKIRSL